MYIIIKITHTISNMNAYQAGGWIPGRSWDRMATAGLTFRAKDGYVVMAVVRLAERWRQLWQMAGREDLLEDPRYLGQGGNEEFYFHQIIPAIEGWSQSYTTREVAEKLTEIDFSMGVAQAIADLDQCPHLESRDMFVETGDTLGGQFRSIRTPVRLTACEDSPATTPPRLGENNQDILCSLGGLTPEEVDQLTSEGAL